MSQSYTPKLTPAELHTLTQMPGPTEKPKLIRENVTAAGLATRGLALATKLRCVSEPYYRLTSAGVKMLARYGRG